MYIFNKKLFWIIIITTGILFIGSHLLLSSSDRNPSKIIKLPQPDKKGRVSVEEAIFNRKSIRNYKDESLSLKQLSQLVWAGGGKTVDGITGATRSYPSAGGIYPLNIYIVVSGVEGLSKGIYKYNWQSHTIELVRKGDFRSSLCRAALGQMAISRAPVSLVFTAVYSKTTRRYGMRGKIRYVHMDLGHAAENVYLQAEALGLGTVAIGAFNDKEVGEVLGIEIDKEQPLYIMPVGKY